MIGIDCFLLRTMGSILGVEGRLLTHGAVQHAWQFIFSIQGHEALQRRAKSGVVVFWLS